MTASTTATKKRSTHGLPDAVLRERVIWRIVFFCRCTSPNGRSIRVRMAKCIATPGSNIDRLSTRIDKMLRHLNDEGLVKLRYTGSEITRIRNLALRRPVEVEPKSDLGFDEGWSPIKAAYRHLWLLFLLKHRGEVASGEGKVTTQLLEHYQMPMHNTIIQNLGLSLKEMRKRGEVTYHRMPRRTFRVTLQREPRPGELEELQAELPELLKVALASNQAALEVALAAAE